MSVALFIACIGFITGGFLILNLSINQFAFDIGKRLKKKKVTMRDKIKEIRKPKKVKGIRLLIKEAKEVLTITGRSSRFEVLCVISLSFFVLGAFTSLLFQNVYLVPVLAVGFSLMPFWYVIFTATFYKKQLNSELETALSIITTAYMRNENIIMAVEENVSYLNPPVNDVFSGFLTQSKLINSNLKLALSNMKGKISSDVFEEWIDAVIACQEDKSLKTTLTPIISKLSDMRIVSAELDYLLYEPLKEFITMAILLIANIPLVWFINKDWYHTLMFTDIGKIVLAICACVIFVSLAAVIRLTKPIEYKR